MASPADPHTREALDYWSVGGSFFKANKLPSDKLDRLLRGIAASIVDDSKDLTPVQMAAFYRRVGGNYDPLFLDLPPQSTAFIYKSLGCLHSLQPTGEDGFVLPSVPALKPLGFVTWQAIQLLLGPAEHVPFVQRALREFNVLDPVDGTPFPKLLPAEAFPSKPDEHMVRWHQGVSERLRIEAQQEQEQSDASRRTSINSSVDGAADERADAAQYFSNPHYKNRDGRPAIVRHLSKEAGQLLHSSQELMRSMREFAIGGRRQSMPEKGGEDAYGSDVATPKGTSSARSHHTNSRHRSPHRNSRVRHDSPRRARSPSPSTHHNPLRHHRSHEPARSPRYHDHVATSPKAQTPHRRPMPEEQVNQFFGPSDSPPFAVKVAQVNQPGYFDLQRQRVNSPATYGRSQGRLPTRPSVNTQQVPQPYRQMVRTPSNSVPPPATRNSPLSGRLSNVGEAEPLKGVHGRRYVNEVPWR